MHSMFGCLRVVLLVVITSSMAPAQTTSKPLPAPKIGAEIPSRPLLMEPTVQKEIGLTTKQKNNLAQVEVDREESRQENLAEPGDEGFDFNAMMGGLEVLDRQRNLAIAKILTASQKTRLLQIEWQREGWPALGRSDVAVRVKLSRPQLDKIRTIIRNMRQAQAPNFFVANNNDASIKNPSKPKLQLNPSNGFIDPNAAELPGGGPMNFGNDDFRNRADKSSSESAQRALEAAAKEVEAILTAEQKEAFERLLGPPFALKNMSSLPVDELNNPATNSRKPTMKKSAKPR